MIDGLSIGGNHLESWNRHSAPWKNFHHPSRSHDLCHRAAVQTCLDHGEKGPFEWTEEDLKHCILWSLTTDLFPWVQNWIDTTVGLLRYGFLLEIGRPPQLVVVDFRVPRPWTRSFMAGSSLLRDNSWVILLGRWRWQWLANPDGSLQWKFASL